MARRNIIHNWSSGISAPAPSAAASEFERVMFELGLTLETCVDSLELKEWCLRNKDRKFIPEWLLKHWQMPVDPNLAS